MKTTRPIFLDLTAMHFPPTAIASILHRISGVVLFLYIPWVLWLFHQSLSSEIGFSQVMHYFQNIGFKLLILFGLAAWIYHLFAGIRHLVMDLGYGESLQAGTRSAYAVIALSILCTVIMGVWLW